MRNKLEIVFIDLLLPTFWISFRFRQTVLELCELKLVHHNFHSFCWEVWFPFSYHEFLPRNARKSSFLSVEITQRPNIFTKHHLPRVLTKHSNGKSTLTWGPAGAVRVQGLGEILVVADEFIGARLFLGGQLVAGAMRHADGLLQTLKSQCPSICFIYFL